VEQLANKRLKANDPSGAPPSKKKIKVENKDPSAPKKPVNAYVMFFQHQRHAVAVQYLKVSELIIISSHSISAFG